MFSHCLFTRIATEILLIKFIQNTFFSSLLKQLSVITAQEKCNFSFAHTRCLYIIPYTTHKNKNLVIQYVILIWQHIKKKNIRTRKSSYCFKTLMIRYKNINEGLKYKFFQNELNQFLYIYYICG